MTETEKCSKCDDTGFYYTAKELDRFLHNSLEFLPEEAIKTKCDCPILLHKYEKLLEFVNQIHNDNVYYYGNIAEELLKEIGEL